MPRRGTRCCNGQGGRCARSARPSQLWQPGFHRPGDRRVDDNNGLDRPSSEGRRAGPRYAGAGRCRTMGRRFCRPYHSERRHHGYGERAIDPIRRGGGSSRRPAAVHRDRAQGSLAVPFDRQTRAPGRHAGQGDRQNGLRHRRNAAGDEVRHADAVARDRRQDRLRRPIEGARRPRRAAGDGARRSRRHPALVDETANITDAAKKIVWGAMAWGGQWCTSPGYAYVHEAVADAFVAEAKKALVELFGDDPKSNSDYSRIINAGAVKRLASLIDPSKVVAGGKSDPDARYLDPTFSIPSPGTTRSWRTKSSGRSCRS
jgi:hypothetical protein